MNKEKGIIIGILALIVTMMVGYAIFSETITINGTATAKGDFELSIACNGGLSSEIGVSNSEFISSANEFLYAAGGEEYKIQSPNEHGYKNDVCTVLNNDVTFKVDFNYPGAYRLFTVKITNAGSIPALLDSKNLTASGGQSCGTYGCNGAEIDSIAAYYKDGVNYLRFDNMNMSNGELIENPILEPEESVYVVFRMGWNSVDNSNKADKEIYYSAKMPFIQVTND